MQESSVGDYRVEPAPRPWWRRRWFRAALAVVLLPVFVVAGLYFYMDYQGRKELKAAIAETDALDPNWQLDDIDASLKVIPDRANAALVVIDVKSLLPSPWPPRPA